jgi:hypothetical protein
LRFPNVSDFTEIRIAAIGTIIVILFVIDLILALTTKSGGQILPTNSTALIQSDPKGLLSNVLVSAAAVLGSVFAIVFAFSQFFISNIADKYSPRMLGFFRRNPRYVIPYLLVFFSTITSVVLLLLLDILSQGYLYLTAGTITVTFAVSLLAFLIYHDYIYQVVDPLNFSRIVEKQIRSSLNNSTYAETGATALADSAIKATNRGGEEENVIAFINSLANVACDSIRSRASRETENPLFSQVMESLLRIHNAALAKKESNVALHISFKVREINVALNRGA